MNLPEGPKLYVATMPASEFADMDEIVTAIWKSLEETILQGDEFIPMFHGLPKDEKADHIVLGAPWGSEIEKEMTCWMIRHLFKEHDICRYVVAVESWGTPNMKEHYIDTPGPKKLSDELPGPKRSDSELWEDAMRGYQSVSEMPDKIECCMVMLYDRKGCYQMQSQLILRNEDGSCSGFSRRRIEDLEKDGKLESRFDNLLS